MTSFAKVEEAVLFINQKLWITILSVWVEPGHPQPFTKMTTGNSVESNFVSYTTTKYNTYLHKNNTISSVHPILD